MCGINGVLGPQQLRAVDTREKLKRMIQATSHRGPDDEEIIVLARAGLAFSRLSIIAPTERHTIQKSSTGMYAMCNGEIINFKELRNSLPQATLNNGDTSLVLPLFEKFGPSFITKLAGMFAIAIYDERKHTLHLWRDPMGIKPLYYYRDESCVLFSSEIKGIYAALREKPDIQFAALDHILRYRFHGGRSTVFSTIQRVLPGEHVIISPEGIHTERYWTLGDNIETDRSFDPEEGRQLLEQLSAEYSRADVPGGFFVSGGLDSSLMTALAQRNSSTYQTPISLSFEHPVADEEYVTILEGELGNAIEWVNVSDELARATLESSVIYLDEPIENPINIGTFLMAQRARELGIKTVLTGDGADEIFLGYERYGFWLNASPSIAQKEYKDWLMNVKSEQADELYSSYAKEHVTQMVDGEGVAVEPFTPDNVFKFERWERLQEYHCMRLDRMTMAWSLEARVPFLDHRLVQYSLGYSKRQLFGMVGKALLSELARPYLPVAILNRPKVRFPALPDEWLSGEGAPWMRSILLDTSAKIAPFFNPKTLERYILEHQTGEKKRGRLLWALISLELWLHSYASDSNIH